MAIPNTTPTPNIIFNGLMAKMTDTEFKLVMTVVRATLGWEIDHKTGMRKKEDWISYYQLKKITGRGYTSLAKAINSCIENGWIEARDKGGNLLNTKNKRIGKRVFYRLGREILLKDNNKGIIVKESKPLQKVKRLEPTSSESEISESEITESKAYKRNTIQKKNITKVKQANACDLQKLIKLFEPINPSYERLFPNTTQRNALQRLVDKFGYGEVERLLEALPTIVVKKYAPRITTPVTLENKLGELFIFMKQEKKNNNIVII